MKINFIGYIAYIHCLERNIRSFFNIEKKIKKTNINIISVNFKEKIKTFLLSKKYFFKK